MDKQEEKIIERDIEAEMRTAYALIDSQSVKTIYNSEKRGFDGGKKQKEEKDI